MKVKHSFNEHGKIDTRIHFICSSEAIQLGRLFPNWNVRPASEKSREGGFWLTIRRLP